MPRSAWAVALAVVVGLFGGTFLAGSMSVLVGDLFHVDLYGSTPLLAGDAATFVSFLMAPWLCPSTAALTAWPVARTGRSRLGAVLGSLAGLLTGALVGIVAEGWASRWISTFGPNPLEGALWGGVLAGAVAGAAAPAILRGAGPAPWIADARFAAARGSVLGCLFGLGGGLGGFWLAQSTGVCPNGYTSEPPVLPPNCSEGVRVGGLLFGIWAGAAAGAIAATIAAAVLRRWATPDSTGGASAGPG